MVLRLGSKSISKSMESTESTEGEKIKGDYRFLTY